MYTVSCQAQIPRVIVTLFNVGVSLWRQRPLLSILTFLTHFLNETPAFKRMTTAFFIEMWGGTFCVTWERCFILACHDRQTENLRVWQQTPNNVESFRSKDSIHWCHGLQGEKWYEQRVRVEDCKIHPQGRWISVALPRKMRFYRQVFLRPSV